MELTEGLITRRSIRHYNTQSVSADNIELILKAGMFAPSARNSQPWHFIISDDRDILNKITILHPYAQMLKQAPLAILVCGDKNIEPAEGYLTINCAAATQNILLAAHAIGLGSVWLGVYPRQQRMDVLTELFKLPDHILPVSLIAIGYPDETPAQPDRYLKDRIHTNRW